MLDQAARLLTRAADRDTRLVGHAEHGACRNLLLYLRARVDAVLLPLVEAEDQAQAARRAARLAARPRRPRGWAPGPPVA